MQKAGKENRQSTILEILRTMDVSDQNQLLDELLERGVETNQSTVSRDLSELGVFKADRVYRVSSLPSPNSFIESMDTAGPNLIVVKTPPGQASMVAFTIDHENIPEIAGTLAGDDTIFAAVKGRSQQRRAMGRLQRLFQA